MPLSVPTDLEDIGQVPHSELVVEVDSGLAEGGRDLIVQGQGGLQDLGAHVLNIFLELLQVTLQLFKGEKGKEVKWRV